MDFVKLYASEIPPNLSFLPAEIVLEIAGYVAFEIKGERLIRSLLPLSRASWRLNDILNPLLYEHNIRYMGSSGICWAVTK